MLTFDFETKGIESRPAYPPEPVGVAVAVNQGFAHYLAWGHPSGNNVASAADAGEILHTAFDGTILCHNAAFDIAVAHEKLGLPLPRGELINDTMVLAFLLDPYGPLGLKPLAERYLDMPPTERDDVRAWLQANIRMPTGRKPTDRQCGALISQAPGELVAPYAIGDVERTRQLFDLLHPRVVDLGMGEAYRREMAIMPMLLDNSAQGIPLDVKRLNRDAKSYEIILTETERHLRMLWPKEIGGAAPGNFDSNEELADALEQNPGIRLPLTKTGKRSVAKDNLMAAIPDGRVKGLLLYRSAIEKCLSTYMRPWLAQGKALHCNWNQVRNYEDDGARTGRLSSSPNLQNLTNPEKYAELYALMQQWGCAFEWVKFPNLRSYLIAPKGMVMFSRDYSQQELRLLAHYEDGTLARAYREDPDLDLHVFVRDLINEVTDIGIERKPTKTINFGKVYGMGIPKLAASLSIEDYEAERMMTAYDTALPSVKELQREINQVGRSGDYITTLGGRRYYSPPAEMGKWGIRTYEYKLLNYLIQGGSADQTKQAMRLWWEDRLSRSRNGTRFLLTVHDELVGCAPRKEVKKEAAKLDEYMREAFKLDVPVRTDLKIGTNFGEMK